MIVNYVVRLYVIYVLWCGVIWSCFDYWSVSCLWLEVSCGFVIGKTFMVVDEFYDFVVWRIFLILGVDLRVWKFYNLFWFPEEEVLWSCHLLMNWEILWFCCWFWLLKSFMISILICKLKDFRNLWMIYFKICLWLTLRVVSELV